MPEKIAFSRIICPTDFSDLSARATACGRSLAEIYKAELHLLHVVDEAYQYWAAMGPESMPIGPTPEQVMFNARQQMQRWAERHCTGLTLPIATEIVVGRPFAEIIRYAEEKKADLIVLGTHGRSGLTHMLLGSVTEKVVRRAPCAVLTVREPTESS
jgi:nucleotide-binding universal stress UspA family protein